MLIFFPDLLANTTKYNQGFARQKCRAMEGDYHFSEQYRTGYHGRVTRLYYEDLASNPIKTSRSLYDFTGMDFSSTVRDYISGITSTGRDGASSAANAQTNGETETFHLDGLLLVNTLSPPSYTHLVS